MYAHEMITIGELMEIKINTGFFKTKLQDLYDDGRFTVFHPTVKGLPVMIEAGDTYTLRFCRTNGMFSFDALLLDWYTKDDIRLCLFESQTEVVKAQRRQSFRLPIKLDVTLRLEEDMGNQNVPVIKAKTADLSEHGMLLTSFTSLEVDALVMADLRLSPVDTMALKAKVLRCEKPYDKKDPYRIVLLFVGGSDQQKSDIGRYILRQQIIARKKKNQEVMP